MKTVLRNALVTLMAMLVAANVAISATAVPVLITLTACPSGSARPYPWLLYEDKNGDGFYDYVTAGSCDGTTAGRPLGSTYADPWTPTAYDTVLCTVPDDAMVNSIALGGVHLTSAGVYAWTVTERGISGVCSRYYRDDDGKLVSQCGYGLN